MSEYKKHRDNSIKLYISQEEKNYSKIVKSNHSFGDKLTLSLKDYCKLDIRKKQLVTHFKLIDDLY